MPGPSEVVRSRLARRVGRVRPARGGFGSRLAAIERAVDLIGRDVEKAEALPRPGSKTAPIVGRGLEQAHRSADVRGDEIHWTVDGAVHVRLGGEMNHRIGPRFGERAANGLAVPDVDLPRRWFGASSAPPSDGRWPA